MLGFVLLLGCTTSQETAPPATTPPPTTTSPTSTEPVSNQTTAPTTTTVPTQTEALLSLLLDTGAEPVRVGLVAHRASELPEGRTLDVLDRTDGIELTRIFAPEHGLAGDGDAGEPIDDQIEPETGVEVISLYGERREPTLDELSDLDIVVYDLQDVGVRAYTYIATMGLVFTRAAEADVPVVVLDRPNPQGPVVDGPISEVAVGSFLAPYPIPLSYGLSSGELAMFITGEGMVDAPDLDLRVVGPSPTLDGVWIPPSPNLPTLQATWLYPALVPFEATVLSVGRGSDEPFTLLGGPQLDVDGVLATTEARQLIGLDLVPTLFTPRSIEGMALNPRYEGQALPGISLTTSGPLSEPMRVTIELLDAIMDVTPDRSSVIDRPEVFDVLVGSRAVRTALIENRDPSEIAAEWAADVEAFERQSAPYRR